jgi:hypothetical protein
MWPRCFELSSCQIVHTCILSSFSNVLVIVLSVRWFKASDYFFRTFKLFLYQSLIDVLLIYSSIYQCCMIFCQVVPLVRERIVSLQRRTGHTGIWEMPNVSHVISDLSMDRLDIWRIPWSVWKSNPLLYRYDTVLSSFMTYHRICN